MRRRSTILALLMMLVTIFGLGAFPEYAPYGEDMTIFYSSLTEEEQELYDIIYEGVLDYSPVIEFPHGYPMETVDKVVSIMMDDSPELFWMDHSWSSSYYDEEPDVALDVEIDYIMSERQAVRRWKKMMDFYDNLEFEGDSVLMDELVIIDAICNQTEYVDGEHVYDASASLVVGKAVCEGYAKAAALLMRLRGIPSGVVGGIGTSDGESEPHAWNIVKIGDDWTLLDITWIDEDPASYYDWINLSDEMFASTHEPEDVPDFYFDAVDTYEISKLLELYKRGDNKEYFFKELRQLIEDDIPVLIYHESEKDYHEMLENYEKWLDEYNELNPEEGFYGSYYVAFDDDRMRFYLDRE